jgi:hypothetical protein
MLTLTASPRTVHSTVKARVVRTAIPQRKRPASKGPGFLVILLRALGGMCC